MISVLTNTRVVDVEQGIVLDDHHVVLEEGVIREVTPVRPSFQGARLVDLGGMTLLPGLIDAHVHVTAYDGNFLHLRRESPAYVAARTSAVLREMLSRGFTTVRDVGGADFGIARAVAEGYFQGPRLLFCGKALSPTGGHGDFRGVGVDKEDDAYAYMSLARRCDGVDAVRLAARDEIRRGANHIKIMANGGISSPTDRISSDQFSEAEIAAVVDEAHMAGLYVAAHTYTASSVARAVRNGVLSVEHGNLLDEPTVALMKERAVFYVPTLAVFEAIAEEGRAAGFSTDSMGKLTEVRQGGLRALELAHRAGVPMAYGTDLPGAMHRRQLAEFRLRLEVLPPAEIIRSATMVGARLLRLEDSIGQIRPGFAADMIAMRGDPFDAAALSDIENRLAWVMKAGVVVRDDRQ